MKTLLTFAGMIALSITGIVGWVMNIITLSHSTFNPLTGMDVLRIIGIFVAPLGAVLGLFFH